MLVTSEKREGSRCNGSISRGSEEGKGGKGTRGGREGSERGGGRDGNRTHVILFFLPLLLTILPLLVFLFCFFFLLLSTATARTTAPKAEAERERSETSNRVARGSDLDPAYDMEEEEGENKRDGSISSSLPVCYALVAPAVAQQPPKSKVK